MGARVQVKMIDTEDDPSVYLYSHWGAGGQTLSDVQSAIQRKVRWTDAEYLARIIFEDMIVEQLGSETGHGIGTSLHGDIEELIVIHVPGQRVYVVRGFGMEITHVNEGSVEGCMINLTFEQFANLDLEKAFSDA